MYRKIGSTLAPNLSLGLDRVDIPDPNAKGPGLESPNDPKNWKGPWISITNPEEIAQQICISNRNQYNQAVHTPFGSGPLATLIGHNGDTPTAKKLLNGIMPIEILSSLMPNELSPKDAVITEEEFLSTFGLLK